MNYDIKKYIPEFKSQVLTVWEKSVLATHNFLHPNDFEKIKQMLVGFDFGLLDVFCLIDKNKVVGFIGLNEAKIEMLFLDPDYMKKGLGLKLMNYVETHFNVQFVDVNEQNTNAKKFYEKYGFQVFERSEKDEMGMNYPILKMKIIK